MLTIKLSTGISEEQLAFLATQWDQADDVMLELPTGVTETEIRLLVRSVISMLPNNWKYAL